MLSVLCISQWVLILCCSAHFLWFVFYMLMLGDKNSGDNIHQTQIFLSICSNFNFFTGNCLHLQTTSLEHSSVAYCPHYFLDTGPWMMIIKIFSASLICIIDKQCILIFCLEIIEGLLVLCLFMALQNSWKINRGRSLCDTETKIKIILNITDFR